MRYTCSQNLIRKLYQKHTEINITSIISHDVSSTLDKVQSVHTVPDLLLEGTVLLVGPQQTSECDHSLYCGCRPVEIKINMNY